MLPKNLNEYLGRIEQIIMTLDRVYIERYEEEILTSQRANLRIRIRFTEGHLLEINEANAIDIDVLT